jgi:hypothetical protein
MAKWLKAHTTGTTAYQKALFSWIANNIAYDVPNRRGMNSYRDTAAAITRTLQLKNGLCTDYAVLYAEVCKAGGIPAYVVSGYTLMEGTTVPQGSHDWVVVKDNGRWTIVDPTWGAGAVNNGQYIKKINWKWFQPDPAVAVKTHMPYDPMWQLSLAVVSHDLKPGTQRTRFAFTDSLAAWVKQSRLQRLQHAAYRIRRSGGEGTNPFLMNELDWLDKTIQILAANEEIDRRNRRIDEFNEVNRGYTEVVKLYNEYVSFKNSQFTPEMADGAIKKMVDAIAAKLGMVVKSLTGLLTDEDIKENSKELNEAIAEMQDRVKTEQLFVGKYIKTEKIKRKDLFYQ